MKRLIVYVCSSLLSSPALLAKDSGAKAVYCTQSTKGEWGLQRFKPLIQVQGGTVFAELMFESGVLGEVKLRTFYPDFELAFDYVFDASGKLIGLRGSVTVKSVAPPGLNDTEPLLLADWLGEANLLPGSDGKIPPHHVIYTREKDRIDKPENADTYVGRFDAAPVYLTIQNVPCAAMLKEAERMHATQE